MSLSLALQIIGTSCGIAGAFLAVFKKRACWIAFMVSNISFISLFMVEQIYVPILQYLVFAAINIGGWIKWSRDIREKKMSARKELDEKLIKILRTL